MENGRKILFGTHGYWLSPYHESKLGVLSRAQVLAAKTALESGQGQEVAFPTGRIHQFSSNKVGSLMGRWLILLQNYQANDQSFSFNDPAVNDTVKEFLKLWEYIGRHPEYSEIVHIVNPEHQPRAQRIFDELESKRRSLIRLNPTFHIRSATDFLNLDQIEQLSSSAEQARFAQRERTHPLLRQTGLLMPSTVKRQAEDWFIKQLPSSEALILAS